MADAFGYTVISGAGGGGGGGSSSGTFTTTTTTTSGTNMTLSGTINATPPLTDEEKKKLQQLREDRVRWIKEKKLNDFQKLPSHIRQEMVDEAYVRDFLNAIDNVNIIDFPGNKEVMELEVKETYNSYNGTTILTTMGGNWPTNNIRLDGADYHIYNHVNFKYGKILDEFTTSELAEAHAAATLEETL